MAGPAPYLFGAMRRAAGPELLRALRPLASCPPGSAVITPAFGLTPREILVLQHLGA